MKKFTASTQFLALTFCMAALVHGAAQASPLTKRMPGRQTPLHTGYRRAR